MILRVDVQRWPAVPTAPSPVGRGLLVAPVDGSTSWRTPFVSIPSRDSAAPAPGNAVTRSHTSTSDPRRMHAGRCKDRARTAFDYVRYNFELHRDDERINKAREGKMQVPFAEDPVPSEENITALLFEDADKYIQRTTQPFSLTR